MEGGQASGNPLIKKAAGKKQRTRKANLGQEREHQGASSGW